MTRLLITLLMLISTATAEAAIVRIRSVAQVERSIVRLEDVAEVFEDNSETLDRLKAVTIEPAPAPGQNRRLTLQQITDRLRAHSIDLSSIEFSGRTIVMVSRKSDPALARTTVVAAKQAPAFKSAVTIATVAAEELVPDASVSASKSVKPDQRWLNLKAAEIREGERLVYELVRSYMEEKSAQWGNPRIAVFVPQSAIPKLLDASPDGLRIVDGKNLGSHHFRVSIEITNEFGKSEIVSVNADIQRRTKVVVATRALQAGQVIQASDVELQEVDTAKREATDLTQVVGKETKTFIPIGKRIEVDAVTEPRMVMRGEIVKGVVTSGNIRVTREFKALQDGRPNDAVSVETIPDPNANPPERPTQRRGIVIGMKQVELTDGGETSVKTGLKLIRQTSQ